MKHRPILGMPLIVSLLLGCAPFAGAKDTKPGQAPPISKDTKLAIIRLLSDEFAWTRKPFPMGDKGIAILPTGEVTPDGDALKRTVESRGEAVKAGERVQITNVAFKGSEILLEINGGSKKKTKWYQHIQVGIGADTAQQAPQGDGQPLRGTYLALEFKDYIPEVTLEDLKARMAPVFDFSVKSSAQAYVDTLPPLVRAAITNHEALVGMNKEMVNDSMGRPDKRIRDTDEQNRAYEEWIFGEPPADVQFIRFIGDEVIQVKIMKVNGEKIVRTQREVNINDPAVATAQPKPAPLPRPANAPTLRRPGEDLPDINPNATGKLPNAAPTPTSTDPPKTQWAPAR